MINKQAIAEETETFPSDLTPHEDSNREDASTQVMEQSRHCRQKLLTYTSITKKGRMPAHRKVFSLLLLIQVSSQDNSLDDDFRLKKQI